jgi:hypothetical protein
MNAAEAELLKQGILGVLLVIAGFVIFFLYRSAEAERKKHAEALEVMHRKYVEDLAALQQARIEDHRSSQQLLLELTRTCVAAISSGANAATASKEALAEVRSTIKEHNDNLLEALERTQVSSHRR